MSWPGLSKCGPCDFRYTLAGAGPAGAPSARGSMSGIERSSLWPVLPADVFARSRPVAAGRRVLRNPSLKSIEAAVQADRNEVPLAFLG
jgi:hypothetical protein